MSPAESCMGGSPGTDAQQLPCVMTWYEIRCSDPGNIAPTIDEPAGVSATHGSQASISKKMAPVRRTASSTSDKASIAALRGRSSSAARTPGHSVAGGRSLDCPHRESATMLQEMSYVTTHSGSCFCGQVKFEVTGEPEAMGYCHCESCRHWSAGPVNAFTLWKPDALKVTQGASSIAHLQQEPHELPQVVQEVRRPPVHGPSDVRAGGRLCGAAAEASIRARRARELPGDGAAHQGRPAEAQGLPEGTGRVRRSSARVRRVQSRHIFEGVRSCDIHHDRRRSSRVLRWLQASRPAHSRTRPATRPT